ncbi:Palmitoyltransferase SWF1 [Escovopsis weberi]|uniref:Palmitoyltransferase n=1 Tax=Escovopsis weberi TaxID=150374 RepID=A0A0M8N177_ESCWE|nr:Palmitoyltransferase SWF1 [Escovopsis weberi]
MDTFKQIIWLILAITFMTFLTFFGRLPLLRNTPVGTLYKLFWSHIFFLAIMVVSEYLFLPGVWLEIGWFTKLTAVIAVLMPYYFLYVCCTADPGYITPENHAYHMSLYPYDHANFHPGNECRTCCFIKPPRSKHCDLCKRCVARADHHCVFINSCVGYGNHGAFLLLLASTALLATYGGLLGLSLMTTKMKLLNPAWSLWPSRDMSMNKYLLVWAWGLQGNIHMGAATLLALLTSPLIWGLFLYSLFLVYCGTTTNESMKWSEYSEEIADGYAYRRALPADRARDLRFEPKCDRWPAEPEHIMLTTTDGRAPSPDDAELLGKGEWERVQHLRDVNNIYDQGFWYNLCDVFIRDYRFRADVNRHNAS